MNYIINPDDILEDPDVEKYFLSILKSDLSNKDKYGKFIQFFKSQSKLKKQVMRYGSQLLTDDKNKIDKILSKAGQETGIWNPKKIIEQTEDSIKRANRRLKNSQHPDKGWGFEVEKSNLWGTSYAVLCLNSAKELKELAFDVDIDGILKKGIGWLDENPKDWSVRHIPPEGEMPVYEISLVIRCFYQIGKEYFKKSFSTAISQCIHKLIESQNKDGGWDAQIWGADRSPTKVYSEVGATNAAVMALAETKNKNLKGTIKKGIQWLINSQNENGSWNNGSCHPNNKESFELSGIPVINKTCDALEGILIGEDCNIDIEQFKDNIDKAVKRLQGQEKPILDDKKEIMGWGWDYLGYSAFDVENTCLTLEALVRMPDAALPVLTSNAQWLMKNQYKKDGDIEDGNWKKGHTARITLSLVEYYKKIKESSLFI